MSQTSQLLLLNTFALEDSRIEFPTYKHFIQACMRGELIFKLGEKEAVRCLKRRHFFSDNVHTWGLFGFLGAVM